MKTTILLLALALASCSPVTPPEWTGPNPLDTPSTIQSPPESMGDFGPHSEHYR